MPGDSIAHYLGFRGGGEDIFPMVAASVVFYFALFWTFLTVFDCIVRRKRPRRDTT